MTDFNAVKEQQQRTWALGDFAVIGWNLALMSRSILSERMSRLEPPPTSGQRNRPKGSDGQTCAIISERAFYGNYLVGKAE